MLVTQASAGVSIVWRYEWLTLATQTWPSKEHARSTRPSAVQARSVTGCSKSLLMMMRGRVPDVCQSVTRQS